MGIFGDLIAIAIGIFAHKVRGRNGVVWGAGTLAIISLGKVYIHLAGGSEWMWTLFVSIVAMLLLVGLKPGSNTARGTVECPFCAEKVSVKAKVCKHCGKDLPANIVDTQAAVDTPPVAVTSTIQAKPSGSWLRKNAGEFALVAIVLLIFAGANGKIGNLFGGVSQAVGNPAPVQQQPVAAPIAIPTTGNLPTFSQNEGYAAVRQKMQAAGWQPFHSPDADVCPQDDVRCQGRPEMEACAGTGMANCRFLWQKDGKTIAVMTAGEDAAFSGFEQVGGVTASTNFEGIVVAPPEQGKQYVLRMTIPKVLAGDADCGQQQKSEIELWDVPSKLQPYVGKSVSVVGQLDCPRGGYVLRSISISNAIGAAATTAQSQTTKSAFSGYWRCAGIEGDDVRSLYFGEDGRYGVYAKTKAGDEGYFAGQWNSVDGKVRTTVQARKAIAFSAANMANSPARNQWQSAGGGWNEQRIESDSPDRIRVIGLRWQDERGQSGPLSTRQECQRLPSNIHAIQFP